MGQLKTRPRKTVDDYMKLPEGVRAELIEGEILKSPSPKTRHQRRVLNITVALREFVEGRGLGHVFVAPLDVHLPSRDVVQPDVLVVFKANEPIIQDWIRGVPDLVVEVISPDNSERDLLVKRRIYAQNGIPEYWLVDGESLSVEVLKLVGDRYDSFGYFEMGETVTSAQLAGLAIPLRQVFE